MPPADEVKMSVAGRSRVIDWLSRELQVASQVARSEQGHSSFRRMTRYEYNYVLQDLLGLPFHFVEDLPPETTSEDGFLNSSEMLQTSVRQFETYREIAHQALQKATVRGERPMPVYYSITMETETRYCIQTDRSGSRQNSKAVCGPTRQAQGRDCEAQTETAEWCTLPQS